ncbi:MAG: hypothetical protein K2J65_11205 [Duncaniella sp.]|nr:hypothetical protein [Duncaniella sp.]MDE6860965.1 hypothetical protein [Duncaniella sp.]MDE7145861.1 hypothetical protein [Duncaniella sp.]
MDKNQIIDTLIAENKLEDAVRLMDEVISENSDSDILYFRRGKLRWRLGDRSGAMSDYAKAKELNPESPASKALEQAYDVANFFNPDLYNP